MYKLFFMFIAFHHEFINRICLFLCVWILQLPLIKELLSFTYTWKSISLYNTSFLLQNLKQIMYFFEQITLKKEILKYSDEVPLILSFRKNNF